MVVFVGCARRVIGIWLIAAFAVFASDRGAEAQTFTLSVSGKSYGVTLQPFFESFDDNEGVLVTTPWYGNPTLAEDIAQAFIDLGVLGPLNGGQDNVWFAFASNGTRASVFRAIEGFPTPHGPQVNWLEAESYPNVAYASGFAYPVPEIDGNALFKALFCLFTLALWLQVRRGRRARG